MLTANISYPNNPNQLPAQMLRFEDSRLGSLFLTSFLYPDGKSNNQSKLEQEWLCKNTLPPKPIEAEFDIDLKGLLYVDLGVRYNCNYM